jgi:hypothetical protein
MSTKKFHSNINITTGSSLIATNTTHTLGSLVVSTNGNVGIGTTAPTNALQVNGTISRGGYAIYNLTQASYPSGWSTLQWGTSLFSSGITNNTSSITLQDPGVYMFIVKLNSDTNTNETGNFSLACENWNGSTWVLYQSSEQYVTYTNNTEFLTNFLVQSTNPNQQWRIRLWHGRASNIVFSPDIYWSRWMIYKVG